MQAIDAGCTSEVQPEQQEFHETLLLCRALLARTKVIQKRMKVKYSDDALADMVTSIMTNKMVGCGIDLRLVMAEKISGSDITYKELQRRSGYYASNLSDYLLCKREMTTAKWEMIMSSMLRSKSKKIGKTE